MAKRIFESIQPQDWFAAIDLKNTYFHVSILPRHRPFLRFAFEGQAYQYTVLPFGLALSPRVFTKVVEAALVPLQQHGVRILNYLDDWLTLAHSRDRHIVVSTDASATGWGAMCNGHAAAGSWTGPQRLLHVNCLKLLAVRFALHRFLALLKGQQVLVRTDNTATVVYINRQGGLRSRRMSQLARLLLIWSQKHLRSLRAVHILGELNRAADELSQSKPLPGEWRFHLQSVQLIWEQFDDAQGSGPAAAEARRRSQTWGSQMDLSVDVETGPALSQPQSDRSSASHQGVEARVAVSSPPIEAPILQLSSSEELDVVSIEAESEDSPPQSHAFEELLDVITRAVDRLSIEWPEDRQDVRSKSKLDERFLPSRAQPQRRSLPFFPDLHTEVWRSWGKPVSYRVFSPHTSH
ncbi:hypothetical protein PO909_022516 [Leuciscus waleckii]